MRFAGLDPSSTLCAGAVAEGDELYETWVWEKSNNRSAAWNLSNYFVGAQCWLRHVKTVHAVGVCVVEFLSVMRNANATRAVSHFQAASALAAKEVGLVVVEARVSTVRKIVLGNGGLSKDDAYELILKRFPEHKWQRTKSKGRKDETDAAALALAGPDLIERERA